MTADGPIRDAYRRESARRRLDLEVAALAEAQHGVVTLVQLSQLGLGHRAVHRRVEAGRLHSMHQGTFAVGHRGLSRHGHLMAAVLACGPGAALSHRTAAALWEIVEDAPGPADVTAPNRRGRSPVGISSHRAGRLRRAERTERHGIPCTTVERTLLDLAAVASVAELRRAVAEAEVLRLFDLEKARAVIDRHRGRRGDDRFRMVLDEIDPAVRWTRSELERKFLGLCARLDLPRPEVNVLLDLGDVRFRPDFLWREQRLIVETDSRRFHDTNRAFEADRLREQRLQMAGWRVSHCTWNQVRRESRELAKRIRRLLEIHADGPKADA